MASPAVGPGVPHPLLTLGRVDRVRVQVGYRSAPDDPAYEQYLLDVPLDSEATGATFDEARALAALEPVLYVGADRPRHYSLHQHRWHTSWGPSPGVVELGLLVTTGPRTATLTGASDEGVARAFHELLESVGRPDPFPLTRDAALLRARASVATAYATDPAGLSISTEEHHPGENSWTLGLRTPTGDGYQVVVGFVDGYAGAVRVRHGSRLDVHDSLGSE